MTKEEAINNNKILRLYMRLSDKYQPCKFLEENYIALDMAIKALEQQDRIMQILDNYDLEAWEILEKIKEVVKE